MGTKYTSTTVSGYNSSPPPDDGSTQASNKITWAGIKQKLGDTLNSFASSIDTKLVTALDASAISVTGTYGASATDNGRKLQCAGTFNLTLPDAATVGAGWWVDILVISGVVTLAHSTVGDKINGETISTVTLPAQSGLRASVNATADGFNLDHLSNITYEQVSGTVAAAPFPTGSIIEFGGSSAPSGWLLCDGAEISRTTYATLFAVIGTTYGAGDTSTTFNVPDYRGRVAVGAGTGATVEDVTASSSNGFTVVANSSKWITGMPVVLSNLTGFTTSASAGPTYYVSRISTTNVRLSTTLALAQAGTPNVTISGTGTATITCALTARTRGEQIGEEAHAQTSNELFSHTHPDPGHYHQEKLYDGGALRNAWYGGSSAGGSNASFAGITATFYTDTTGQVITETATTGIGASGGNVRANTVQPGLVVNKIIKT